ncbi:MAG: cysteine peptidase family C39 domain-containing protein [Ginsengibacter sp.]
MKYVEQKDDNGCGIACIAMVTEQSYEDVKFQLVNGKIKGVKKKSNLITNYVEIIRIAAYYGKKLSKRKIFHRWKDIPGNAIVSTDFHEDKIYYHWIVFVKPETGKAYFLDPYPKKGNGGERRYNFRGKKCGSYLLINDDK